MKHRRFGVLASLTAAAGLSFVLNTPALAATGLAAGGSGGAHLGVASVINSSTFVKFSQTAQRPRAP